MKRIFSAIALLLVGAQAFAQTAYAIRWDQRNAANSAYLSRFIPPDTMVDCLLVVSPTSAGAVPSCVKLGGGFVNSGGTISVPVTTGPQGATGAQGPQGVQGIQGVAGNDGANGTNGANGSNGANGQSAYETAVTNGFVGTEVQWLASLVGPTGPAGATGATGAVGNTGATGATGPQGPAGTAPTRSFSYATRALNTCFQVSSTRDAQVSYSVDILTSLTLLAGQQGTVYMRIYSNNTCTTGIQEVARFVNGQTGALTIGLSLAQNVTGTLSGVIPAGAFVQLVTENNTGTPTFTARPGQEVLL